MNENILIGIGVAIVVLYGIYRVRQDRKHTAALTAIHRDVNKPVATPPNWSTGWDPATHGGNSATRTEIK